MIETFIVYNSKTGDILFHGVWDTDVDLKKNEFIQAKLDENSELTILTIELQDKEDYFVDIPNPKTQRVIEGELVGKSTEELASDREVLRVATQEFNDIEAKISNKIRDLAIEALKASGDIPIDYVDR
jgi:hypothetical protein